MEKLGHFFWALAGLLYFYVQPVVYLILFITLFINLINNQQKTEKLNKFLYVISTLCFITLSVNLFNPDFYSTLLIGTAKHCFIGLFSNDIFYWEPTSLSCGFFLLTISWILISSYFIFYKREKTRNWGVGIYLINLALVFAFIIAITYL